VAARADCRRCGRYRLLQGAHGGRVS
jgi:hypothetical protein